MRRLTILAAFAAAGLSAGEAAAQTAVGGGHNVPRMIEGEALKPAGSFYTGGHSGSREFTPYRVHMYNFRIGGDASPERPKWIPWAVRLIGSGTQDRRVQWADGRLCPGAYSAQMALSDFPSARFQSPRFIDAPRSAGTMPAPDLHIGAPSLAVWGYAQLPDMAFGTMMVTGSDGLIRQWVDFVDSQLEDCWSDTPPDGIATTAMLNHLPQVDPDWPSP